MNAASHFDGLPTSRQLGHVRGRLEFIEVQTELMCFAARDQTLNDPIKGLFCAQRLHGIETGGPACRHDSCGQGDGREEQWHHSEGHWIVWCDAK